MKKQDKSAHFPVKKKAFFGENIAQYRFHDVLTCYNYPEAFRFLLAFMLFCAILYSEVGTYGTIHFDSAKRQAKH